MKLTHKVKFEVGIQNLSITFPYLLSFSRYRASKFVKMATLTSNDPDSEEVRATLTTDSERQMSKLSTDM